MKNKEKNNMLVEDMAIENFAGLPDFEDLPESMQVEVVDGFVVIPDETYEKGASGRAFFKFALCKNETPFCIKHIHADILSLYDTGWKAIYLSKSGYMYFYNYAFKRNNLHCDEENGAVSLVGEHSSLNRKSDIVRRLLWP